MNIQKTLPTSVRAILMRQPSLWIPLRAGALRVTMRHWLLVFLWIVILLLADQTQHDMFFRLAYLILILWLFAFFWTWYQIVTLRLTCKTITPRTQVGRFIEEHFWVHNTGRWTKIWLEVRDESAFPAQRSQRVLNALGARARWSWTVRTWCWQRGVIHLGPLSVIMGDPFGVFEFQRIIPHTTRTIIVYPATVDVPIFAPARGQLAGGDLAHRRTHHITTNVAGTREYAPGDSFNRIHWRSTARLERLIVKEFELDPTADVWIYLDLERAVHTGEGYTEEMWQSDAFTWLWWSPAQWRLPPNTEEYSVTLAASIARYFLRRQRAVGLVAYARRREIVQPDRGERQLTRLLEVLAMLRAEGRFRLTDVLMLESTHLTRSHTLVAITPSAEMECVRALRDIKQRGVGVIAVLVDANTFGGRADTEHAAAELLASGIPTYVIKQGDDLPRVLSRMVG